MVECYQFGFEKLLVNGAITFIDCGCWENHRMGISAELWVVNCELVTYEEFSTIKEYIF